jgi:hypothetical protein
LEHYQAISHAMDLSQKKGLMETYVKVEVSGNLTAQQLNEIHDNNNLFVGVNGD